MSRPVRISVLVLLILVIAGGLLLARSRDESGEQQPPGWATCETEAVAGPAVADHASQLPQLELELVAEADAPTDLATRAGDSSWYVLTRKGTISRTGADGTRDVVLELEVPTQKEQGLLGATFAPDGAHLYITYTDLDGTSRVVAYPVDEAGRLDDARAAEILALEQPGANHNIDELVFGPDGLLYISSGDGGSDTFEGDIPGNGQDPGTLLGAILRIEPDPISGGYDIPADNPFADSAGGAPEVWAYGFRNPWRFSFDRETDDLWIGDVGQYCWEEIDRVPASEAAGANFGWRALEGFHRHIGDLPESHVLPIHAYPRAEGGEGSPTHCAVIGGYVYRGRAIPDLDGVYVFSDFCAGELEGLRISNDGEVMTDVVATGLDGVQSLAEDQDGELYVLAADGVYRLQPAGE